MQLDLQHSLRTHLAEKTGLNVVWVYDGVVLPTAKPFITIEQMQNNNEVLSKHREAIRTTYRFQVGLFANSASERARKQDELRRILLRDTIELISTEQVGQSLGFFNATVTAEVPIPADDISDKTKYHRVYFDVEIDATL